MNVNFQQEPDFKMFFSFCLQSYFARACGTQPNAVTDHKNSQDTDKTFEEVIFKTLKISRYIWPLFKCWEYSTHAFMQNKKKTVNRFKYY